jgi:transposase InsO family protein
MNRAVRHKYDTSIVLLYTQRKEHLLPDHFRKTIPFSTASTWRNENAMDFKGSEFRPINQEAFDWYELFLKYQMLKRTVRILCKVWIAIAGIVKPSLNAKQHTEIVFNEMQKLFTIIPKQLACKLAGWSPVAFRYRAQKIQCAISPLSLCFKRHPSQLASKEISVIKNLMSRPELACWPVSSIAWYAKRENLLHISLSTWYKYIQLLGLKRRFIRPPDKTQGIVSIAPNQFLHVDTTFYPLPDGTKAAIVFVSDNFSKHILGWTCSLKHGAQNVIDALNMAMETIRTYHPNQLVSLLVSDGGGENNAITVEEWIAITENPKITKLIALKDIAFSNSPIEAVNKIMKRYIRRQQPQNIEQVRNGLVDHVFNYTTTRPHGSLEGYTPLEAYAQKGSIMDFTVQTKFARAQRITLNKAGGCQICS